MIAQFALRLICGMSLMWSLMPRGEVTSGFFRIQMLVTLGLSVLSVLTVGRFSGGEPHPSAFQPLLPHGFSTALCVLLAVCSFLGSMMWTLERRRAGTLFAFAVLGISLPALLFSNTSAESLQSSAGLLWLFSELAAAALLGGAVTGMLLGHWYLTTPSMSIAPLSRLNHFFAAAGLARLLLSAIALIAFFSAVTANVHFIWLSLRWVAGVIGPLVVAAMVWRILKYRNTQAATGVLFTGVILCFIGEMTALLLYEELAVPL